MAIAFPAFILSSETGVHRMTLVQAEQSFLKNNLELLAAKFNIEASKGEILQAALWDNPELYLEQNVYNWKTHRYFDISRKGESIIQVQQLFVMGDKRRKRVQLARLNTQVSEYQFYNLLRSLRAELRTDFLALFYMRRILGVYNRSIDSIRFTTQYAEKSFLDRDILLTEVLRLKSILFKLESDRSDLLNDISQREAKLQILLNDPDFYKDNMQFEFLVDEEQTMKSRPSDWNLESIYQQAFQNRPDLRAAKVEIQMAEVNLALQEAQKIPDLTLGANWDRAGNYINNYYGVSASIKLPVLNQNQGNIRKAMGDLSAKKVQYQSLEKQVENEIRVAFKRAEEKDRLYRDFRGKFAEQYRDLAALMTENYRKRYLSILEFADFYETYLNSLREIVRLEIDRVDAIENLNYVSGKVVWQLQPITMEVSSPVDTK